MSSVSDMAGSGPHGPAPHRRDLGAVDRIAEAIEAVLVAIAGLIAVVLMFFVTLDVAMRSLFNAPIQNSYEYMALGMVPIVYLGLATVQARNENICIESATNWLPARGRAMLELVGCLIGFAMMVAIVYWGTTAAWHAFETQEYLGSVSRVQIWPFRTLLVIGALMLTARLGIDCVRLLLDILRPQSQSTAVPRD